MTLTFNRPGDGRPVTDKGDEAIARLRDKLKTWDAHMQRRLFGSQWSSLHDRRFFSVYTIEKTETNPHWHGLIRFFDATGDELLRQGRVFDEHANDTWRKFVPAGDVVVKSTFDEPGAIDYVAKSLASHVNYAHYVLPDSFWRP